MKSMQWRKCLFELDTVSGPLETGDFGEIGDFGENRQRAGDIQNVANSGPFKLDNKGRPYNCEAT